MSWIILGEADVLTRLSGAELAGFRAAALGSGQVDPVADVINQTVEKVRGKIAACLRNTLAPDPYIPASLKQAALSLIILDIQARAAGRILDPQGERKDAAGKADELLNQVAKCEFAIPFPSDVGVTTEQFMVGTPSFNRHCRHNEFSRRQQNGI